MTKKHNPSHDLEALEPGKTKHLALIRQINRAWNLGVGILRKEQPEAGALALSALEVGALERRALEVGALTLSALEAEALDAGALEVQDCRMRTFAYRMPTFTRRCC